MNKSNLVKMLKELFLTSDNESTKCNTLFIKLMSLTVRIFALVATVILVKIIVLKIGNYSFFQLTAVPYELVKFILNCTFVILFIPLIIWPMKLEILSLISILYSIQILIFEPYNMLGILMYGLAILILHARGSFNKYKRIKQIIVSLIYLFFVFSELRFGKEIFLSVFVKKLVFTFIFILCLLFFQIYTFDIFATDNSNHKLDIKKFSELDKRDAEWLSIILNGEKYEYIAIQYNLSLGSVKNRFKIIFREIGVGDRKGFFLKYSDYEICYGEDFTSKNKLFEL